MTFLYVGLGIAMISGISAMMQVGNNVNNLMLLSTFAENEYYQSTPSLPSNDKKIMRFLNNYSGPDSGVCSNVKEHLNDTLYQPGTPSESSFFTNYCVLDNSEINHRVLIKKNNLQSFNFFSCYLKEETFCPYELNK